jgi:hypothetical protein
MNSAYPIESTIRTSSIGRRIRAAMTRLTSKRRPELTREELAQLHEQSLLAERLLDNARTFAYTARLF